MNRLRFSFVLFFFPLCLALVGCGGGSGTYSVTGKVTFPDGSPVPGGMIIFHPVDTKEGKGQSALGTINADGTYELQTLKPGDGAPVGSYKVTLFDPPAGGDEGAKLPPLLIDPKYADPGTSGLTFQVEPKANVFNITVTKAPKGARKKIEVDY